VLAEVPATRVLKYHGDVALLPEHEIAAPICRTRRGVAPFQACDMKPIPKWIPPPGCGRPLWERQSCQQGAEDSRPR
jgi:hypothetical protein